MKNFLHILRRCPLFDQIQDDEMLTMLSCLNARVISFDKKYTIIAEGTPARHIGIILSGSAQIINIDYFGNRHIVSNLEPSDMFGEAFVYTEMQTVPVDIIANEPCEVMLIDAHHLLHTCSNSCRFHRQLIHNLVKALAIKNIMFHQKAEITAKRSTREKLMAYLLQYAKKVNSSRFEIPFDRQELADYLGVDRSGLSVEIGRLRREGVIKSERKHFELL